MRSPKRPRQKIAETLADKETADAAGLTVEEWLEIGDPARRRIKRQIEAGFEISTKYPLRVLKAAKEHGVTPAQWSGLTPNQRKHFSRTKAKS